MAITRRRFLQGMGATGVALGLGNCSHPQPGQPPASRPAKPILVLVFLDGGYDWLNLLPPLSGPNRTAYETARPTLAIPQSGIDDLGGGVGLNKDMAGMFELAQLGRVAWLPGIGMPNANLSHFVATDLWGMGASAATAGNTGWLGRYADGVFAPTGDVLRGITVTGDVPLMLRGRDRSFVSITGPSGYVYPSWLRSNGRLPATWEPQLLEDGFAAGIQEGMTSSDPAQKAAATAQKLFLDAQNGYGLDGTLPSRTPGALYPGDTGHPIQGVSTSLARQLKLIAQMIAAGVPGEVFFTRLGGWDTHSNQAADHPRLLRALGGSIRSFYEDLSNLDTPDGNALERTLIVGWSEFGRRVPENNGGTDHGTAGLSFAVGRGVKGGVLTPYPDLANLDRNANMVQTADYRSLYSTVLQGWLGRDQAATDGLLGARYDALPFL